MAAPKGNQFWKNRSKHGRDKLFASAELLWDAACEYFQWCDENPWAKEETKIKANSTLFPAIIKAQTKEVSRAPTARPYTLSGLCLYLGCNQIYFSNFKGKLPEGEEDFNEVIKRIEETIYTHKFEGATVGAFNANIISRDLGLIDKIENEHKGRVIMVLSEDDADL